jgi:heptosyltransferase-1
VGIDSGPLHLAAALAKPGVAIFGPTDPERNGPYCKSFAVLRDARAITSYKRTIQAEPCMRAIRPEAVFEALEEILAGRSRPADHIA